jgi:hypothetical protein
MSNSTCTRVSIDKLTVDGKYQRPVAEKRVAKIIDEFDAKLLGTLELSARPNGTYAVIDGQHRYEALKKLGRKQVPALVHKGLSVKDEADLFARTNMGRKALSPIQRFRAQVFAGDPQSVAISKIVTTAGFRIDYNETSTELGVIRSVVVLEQAYKRHGAEHLTQLLTTIRDLWFGERAATDATLIRGMSKFLSIYGGNFTSEHAERLARTPALAIVRRAQEKSLTGTRDSVTNLIADDMRKLAGLRGAAAKGVKTVSEDEEFERHLSAV